MQRDTLIRVCLISLALVLLLASPAYANVLLGPLILLIPIVVVPGVLALIIMIESVFLSSWVGVSLGYALWVVSVSNVVSTLFGIPLVLFLLLPGALSTDREEREPWVVPAQGLLLVLLFWAASWVIESATAISMLGEFDPQDVDNGVLVGNLATYGIVAGFLLGWLIWKALRAFRASLPRLRPVEETREVPTALIEAEGDGQYQPIEAEEVVAEAGLQFQRVLTNADNGMKVTSPESLSLAEDRTDGRGR